MEADEDVKLEISAIVCNNLAFYDAIKKLAEEKCGKQSFLFWSVFCHQEASEMKTIH